MNGFDAELYEFIRRLGLRDDALRGITSRVAALEQGMRDAWSEVGTGGFSVVHVTGTVTVLTSLGLPDVPGTTLRLVGHTTGFDYGTFNLPAGTVDLNIVSDPRDGGEYDFYVGPLPRIDPTAFTTRSSYPTSFPYAVASGYHVHSGFKIPLADSLRLDDSHFGATGVTLNWTAGSWINASAPTVPRWAFPSVDPPSVNAVQATGSGGTGNITSRQDPDTTTTKLDITFTFNANSGPYVIGDTIRVYEP